MRFSHVRRADLNLLEPLFALLEECHVTRAAARCGLSQPAMSRALERLRGTFDDELLVRTGSAYERTPRGERLLADLQDFLPRLDTAIRGNRFEPAQSTDHFYIATTDYAAAILIPALLERVAMAAPHARINIIPWSDATFDDVEAGRVQLAIIGARAPHAFQSEELFEDEFACVVSEKHPLRAPRVTLKRYLDYGHAVIAIKDGVQPWIDYALADRGLERRVALRTPFQLSAILAAAASTMICTTARRLATRLAPATNVRLLRAPKEFPKLVYQMAWHRRLQDDAGQLWLRDAVREVAATL